MAQENSWFPQCGQRTAASNLWMKIVRTQGTVRPLDHDLGIGWGGARLIVHQALRPASRDFARYHR